MSTDDSKNLETIALNTSVTSDMAEQAIPQLQNTVAQGFANFTDEARSINGTLRLILVALVVIVIILLVK